MLAVNTNACPLVAPNLVPLLPFHASVVLLPANAHPVPPTAPPPLDKVDILTWLNWPELLANRTLSKPDGADELTVPPREVAITLPAISKDKVSVSVPPFATNLIELIADRADPILFLGENISS